MTARKIKICDDDLLREKIDSLYQLQSQIIAAQWAVEISKHIISISGLAENDYPVIAEGIEVNEQWQNNRAKVRDVRAAAFKIHEYARNQQNNVYQNVFRVIGHAIASGHMKEHALVCSDYAVKVINLLYHNDYEKSSQERKWQLERLVMLADSTLKNKIL